VKQAFIIDPIETLDPGHDTSVALMEAAQAQDHEVWITQFDQLSIIDGQAWATLTPISLQPVRLVGGLWVAPADWFTLGQSQLRSLSQMDAIWMRKDPPVTVTYLYATYLLDYVDPHRTLIINHPQGLRAANEKMYALQFQDVIPETIVTQNKAVILDFVHKKEKAVLKPLGGKAGEGILLLQAEDRNLNSLIEISTHRGQEPVMVQVYLPGAQQGDKRIILLDGEPLGAVNRVPRGQEFRGNMATGGQVMPAPITERDQAICAQLAPVLKQDGLMFVGIDVIGGYLTEVNVTSPTGIREIDRLDDTSIGEQVMHWLAKTHKGFLQHSA
jgi:glutathione synthase